jgi:hypothetical protein
MNSVDVYMLESDGYTANPTLPPTLTPLSNPNLHPILSLLLFPPAVRAATEAALLLAPTDKSADDEDHQRNKQSGNDSDQKPDTSDAPTHVF